MASASNHAASPPPGSPGSARASSPLGAMESLGETSAEGLRQELLLARQERAEFEAQYKGLLGKLTQMRATLGERLRRDAEELEERESQVEALTGQVESLSATVNTLQEEVNTSNAEAERLHAELQQAKQSPAPAEADKDHVLALEHRLREVLEEVEQLKVTLESWQSTSQSERALRTEAEDALSTMRESKATAEAYVSTLRDQLAAEQQTTRELQDVLAELEASKAEEVARASNEAQDEILRLTTELEEQKKLAEQAEKQRDECADAAGKSQALEQEIKERNLLIGKLRHEAVILNEHLTEALRRLRTESSENNVDRRLVTNLFLQFLSAPRGDAKRFEMLSIMASVLGWTEDERETAGLARRSRPSPLPAGRRASGQPPSEDEPSDAQSESFTRMFVQFLLREADSGAVPNGQGAPEKA